MKFIFICAMLCCLTSSGRAAPPDSAKIKNAISTGTKFIRTSFNDASEDHKSFLALAMYKGGLSYDAPEIKGALEHILKKFEAGKYKPGSEHLYEAGVEATLLADLDPEKYRPQLQILVEYILSNRMSNGGWDYPNGGHGSSCLGDTSVVQYVMLGLWAGSRAGIEVPDKVWEDTLKWHVQTQNDDGGFGYAPGTTNGEGAGASTLNMTVNAIGSMHIAMLQIDPEFLPLRQEKPKQKKNDENKKESPKFGVLEVVNLEQSKPTLEAASISPESIQSLRRAFGYLATRFMVENKASGAKAYYYYSLERMAALADIDKIGSHEWFGECATFLINMQDADGSWKNMSKYWKSDIDTAFAVLFLTRSTGKLLKRIPPPDPIGDGLLAGGRGLPDDLADAQFDGRSMKEKPKPTEPLDKLLASLSSTGEINIADVQKQIIENVQLGDRETLIGQIDQLVKLVDHPDPEVRRTVAWALGRTDNMDLARFLIEGLSDKDLGVMVESRSALCWLSRKPKGFGLTESPLEDVSPNATEQQKADAISAWHKKAVLRWGEWYLSNRPFNDRGDEFEARLRANMERLKSGG